MSNPEEEEAKKAEDPGEVLNPPSLAVYYDCFIDRGYIAIEWGKRSNLTHVAYMLFGLRAKEKLESTWKISYDQIEKIKNEIGDQSSDQTLLEKALAYIPDDPVFNTVYTDSDLPS
ncbi:unnamed protein product [Rotaria socialis]|uniref:Uncharacterized protein n=1 Tax=Rotaria socialis TaxID=392032 RepID=A0A821VTK1_9BILA|nr:unnamed protein product [Rotaria socialis]CAF4914492.1 unnamed protein product [Rotaria socialis]